MSEQEHRFASNRGEVVLHRMKPDVLLLKIFGHLDRSMGTFVIDLLNVAVAAHARLSVFCDWSEMAGYDSDVRAAFTQFAATHRSRVTFHLLVGSKIVAMGVSVANLALGGILVGYNNRPAFDAALRSVRMGLSQK
jgi:hypothetical protein